MTQKNITLTPNEEKYVRDNYNRMSTCEMAKNLNLSQQKVYQNMKVMELVPVARGRRKKEVEPSDKVAKGLFDLKAYTKSLMY